MRSEVKPNRSPIARPTRPLKPSHTHDVPDVFATSSHGQSCAVTQAMINVTMTAKPRRARFISPGSISRDALRNVSVPTLHDRSVVQAARSPRNIMEVTALRAGIRCEVLGVGCDRHPSESGDPCVCGWLSVVAGMTLPLRLLRSSPYQSLVRCK